MATYYLGNQATINATVEDSSGALVDPTTIALSLTDPAGTVTTPSFVHDSTGVYHYTFTPATAGHYTWTITTTGAGAGKTYGYLDVVTGELTLSTTPFSDVIDEILNTLHGQTSDMEELTYLTSACSATDLTLSVADATQVTRGLIQIDSELMWVTSVNTTAGTVTVAPFGRGFRDSAPATHAINAMVMNNPRYPRKAVKDALMQTLTAIYPDVFQVLVDESNVAVPIQISYKVPDNCDVILDVRWKNIGPSQLWVPVRRYKLDPKADLTVFATGKSVEIYDGMVPGQTIKITYMAPPGQFSNETDTLGLMGLQDTVRDVLIYGACYRLLASLETSRLQTMSIEQSERSVLTPPGSATQASRYYFTLYEQALQREALRLQKFIPNRTHLVR